MRNVDNSCAFSRDFGMSFHGPRDSSLLLEDKPCQEFIGSQYEKNTNVLSVCCALLV